MRCRISSRQRRSCRGRIYCKGTRRRLTLRLQVGNTLVSMKAFREIDGNAICSRGGSTLGTNRKVGKVESFKEKSGGKATPRLIKDAGFV
jgi:hypothetical protein